VTLYFGELTGEVFEDLVNGAQFRLTDAGPLHAPTVALSIRRNKNLDIMLESVLEQGAVSAYVAPTPGTVTMISATAEMTSLGGMKAIASGISPQGTRPQWNEKQGVFAMAERASLQSIDIDLHSPEPQAYLIEWCLIRAYPLVWPEMSSSHTEMQHKLLLPQGPGGLDIRRDATADSMISWDMVTLNVEGHRVYLREVYTTGKRSKSHTMCMLVYCDETTTEFRRKLQECISFALGRLLVYLGHTTFSADWSIIGARGVRGYSINKRAFMLPPHPPCLLSARGLNMMESQRFNTVVSSLCANYDKLRMSHLSWGYWHAICAPAHIGAAHYGAIIEALRNAYVQGNPNLHGGRIITDTTVREKLANGLREVLDSLSVDPDMRLLLDKKVTDFNRLPTRDLMKFVCDNIGVLLGPAELAAWQRRNDAAHGSPIDPDEQIEVVRDIKLLNGVFTRMLLAMTGASDSYIDYCSPNHPIRPIGEPVPG
jgi:hypothetical protein